MSATSRAFMAIFTLSAPLAHGVADHPPFSMLDGLLGYAVAQETFGPRAFTRRPHSHTYIDLPLPLDQVLPGVHAASQGFAPIARGGISVLVSPYDRSGIDQFSEYSKKNDCWQATQVTARHNNAVIPITTLTSPYFVFFGRGDMSEVERLLRTHIRFLGHKRGAGFGHVVDLKVLPAPVDWSWSRWDAEGVHFHRALPRDAQGVQAAIEAQWGPEAATWWQDHEAEAAVTQLAISPPYHDPNRQQWCYEPDQYGLSEASAFLSSWPGYAPWKISEDVDDDELDDDLLDFDDLPDMILEEVL